MEKTNTALCVVRSLQAAALALALTKVCAGQPAGSLTETEIEASATRTAMNAVLRDNVKLEQKLTEAQAMIASLQNNLTIATTEGEVLKRKASELKLRLEALSIGGGNQDSAIEGRLLKAVATLREAQTHRDELLKAVEELIAAATAYRQATTADPELTLILESATRSAQKVADSRNTTIGSDESKVAATSGTVISLKDELALVVVNIGREAGVKVGMPFSVVREDEHIASVRIVDVRDKFSGAVIQELSSESKKIKVGDRLIIGATQKLSVK